MQEKPRVAAIIPARFASTRFPGKPLIKIGGMTMIERVYKQSAKASLVDEVIVATDDERIQAEVRRFGGQSMMTRSDHVTGTDRLAEVARARPDLDVIVNVQGDEPLIDPNSIDAAARPIINDRSVSMSTLCAPILTEEELHNPNIVKVVFDRQGFALYFSRLPIPYNRSEDARFDQVQYWGHLGLYVFRRETLLRLSELEPTPLEGIEKLEQLRALENGIRINVVAVTKRSLAIDRPEDVEVVEAALAAV